MRHARCEEAVVVADMSGSGGDFGAIASAARW
jgi:hypothetical protein